MKKIVAFLIIAAVLFSGCSDTAEVSGTSVSGENETKIMANETGDLCDPRFVDYVKPVPADPSVPVEDPLPGLKYSFGINDTGRTVTMNKGDTFEITLVYVPTLIFKWTLMARPEGLLLLNEGGFSGVSPDEESYMLRIKGPWNYRWRYLAEKEGTYFFDGVLAVDSCDTKGSWRDFSLTVVVK